jgi:DNA-binding Xre family transcriptional regulator
MASIRPTASTTARKGISSLQLAKELGITQKSAWFILHRIREACGKKY